MTDSVDKKLCRDSIGARKLSRLNFRSSKLSLGIQLLSEAYEYASALEEHHRQFAVEISYLVSAGLSVSDCRALIQLGWACHLHEITEHQSPSREFRVALNLAFSPNSCLALTDSGVRVLLRGFSVGMFSSPADFERLPGTDVTHYDSAEVLKPRFDVSRRELSYRGRVIKRFKQPSANQEKVLIAFQEEDWPPHIDDPLPPSAEICPKYRLGDTIKALNRHQISKLISFSRDGTGEGVCWELIKS